MEFEEMKKIWDNQNNETLYAINETALQKRVTTKKKSANKMVNIIEIMLMLINGSVGIFLIINAVLNNKNLIIYFMGGYLLITVVYLIISRVTRLKKDNQFDRSILGDLEHAIANADYIITIAKKVIWLNGVPLFIMVFVSLIINDAGLQMWLLMIFLFLLSVVLVKWELKKCHYPRKNQLEALHKNLKEA